MINQVILGEIIPLLQVCLFYHPPSSPSLPLSLSLSLSHTHTHTYTHACLVPLHCLCTHTHTHNTTTVGHNMYSSCTYMYIRTHWNSLSCHSTVLYQDASPLHHSNISATRHTLTHTHIHTHTHTHTHTHSHTHTHTHSHTHTHTHRAR